MNVDALGLAVSSFLGLGVLFFLRRLLNEFDSLKGSLTTFQDKAVTELTNITTALNHHANDLGGRIEKTNGDLKMFELRFNAVKARVDEAIPKLFETTERLDKEQIKLAARIGEKPGPH